MHTFVFHSERVSVFCSAVCFVIYWLAPIVRFDDNKQLIGGYEFTLSVRGSVPGDSSLKKVESVVLNAVQNTVNFVLDNYY
jgi:hypothetical protein